jgi:hypothetical protein
MGILDEPMGQVANILIDTFVDGTRLWERREAGSYDPVTGTDPIVTTSAQIKTGPPAPYEDNKIDGDTIRTGDVQVVMARLELERVAPFDPFPTTDATVTVQVGPLTYKVLNVENFISGDQAAAYRFQLRR